MKLTSRTYRSEDDYWRIRQFLRDVYLLNNRLEYCWQVYRFDYWRWHGVENIGQGPLEQKVFLWETSSGELASVLNAEGDGEAFLQIHPAFRTEGLLTEMLETAEGHLAAKQNGQRSLAVWANERDTQLKGMLSERRYRRPEKGFEAVRRRTIDGALPERKLAEGYTLRALGDAEELPARTWASWRGFHPDEPDDGYGGWEWYRNVQRCPLYRRDLDLVAVASGGEIAAFCTVWFDDATRTGAFEPVACVPEHYRKGLASAVMAEGLRRLQRLGATLATVGSYSPHAHALYESMGFTDHMLSEPWEKDL